MKKIIVGILTFVFLLIGAQSVFAYGPFNAPVCSINNFSTSGAYINSGNSVVLSWNTSNCNGVDISNVGYNVPSSGSRIVYPTSSTNYVLTAYGYNGSIQTRSIYINVSYQACNISNFYADNTSVGYGDSTILRWNTENCNSVSIPGIASNLPSSGSYSVYPTSTMTYTLNAYGSYGSDSSSATVYVNNYYNNNSYCSIDSFTASSTYLNSGSPVTLRWNTSNCSNVNISNIGNVTLDGSIIVYPTSTTTYTLGAYGNNSVLSSIQVNVIHNNPVVPIIVYNSNVVTTVATNISETAASLNGLITNGSYTNSNVHFEYGTTVNLGASTASRTLTGSTNFSDYITGLSPHTIYYFQAVSENTNGVSRGAIEVFQTLGSAIGGTVVKPIVAQGTTVIGTESPIVLKVENRYQSVGVNDIIEYTVTYKNIGKVTLLKPILQVIVPKGINITNYTEGTYSQDTNTLTIPLADLTPGEEGSINVQGQVVSMPSDTAQIVTTAVLVYTNKSGAQENAMAYVLNNPKATDVNSSLLGAAAVFSGILPSSLIGLLFLIILVLLLILIARSLSAKKKVTTINHNN